MHFTVVIILVIIMFPHILGFLVRHNPLIIYYDNKICKVCVKRVLAQREEILEMKLHIALKHLGERLNKNSIVLSQFKNIGYVQICV